MHCTPLLDGVTMETANEVDGGGLARSTPASERIAGGPQARDSENNDSSFKEDTLGTSRQLLTCETGNTGTEASTPPCDKVTTGQGSHGTSPADDNLDKAKDGIPLIQLETRDRSVDEDSLERRTELEGMSSDESGEWETASEASIVNDDTNEQKQNYTLDPNGNVDGEGPNETEDLLKIQIHLDKSGGEVTGQPAEDIQQCGGRDDSEDPPVEQAFNNGPGPADTVSEESLCKVGKTEGLKELNDGESVKEPGPGGPHGGKSSHQAVSQLTGSREVDGSQNEEPVYQGMETVLEEPCTGGPHGEQSSLYLEQAGSPLTDQNSSQNEEAINKGFEIQTEKPCTGEPHGEQVGPHEEQMLSQLTGPNEENSCQNEETVSKDIETQIEEPGTCGPHVGGLHEQTFSQLTGSHEKDASPNEEPINTSIVTQMEEPGTGGPHHDLHDEQVVRETMNKDIEAQVEEPCTGCSHGSLQDEQSVSQLTGPHENTSQCEKTFKATETPCTGGSLVEKIGLLDEEVVGESQNEDVDNKGIETAVEKPETGIPHCGLHNEEAFSELTGSHEDPSNKSLESPMEETANKNKELQQNVSAGEQTESQTSGSDREVREPHADKTLTHTEEKVEKCEDSPLKMQDGEDTVPGEELVNSKTCDLETLSEPTEQFQTAIAVPTCLAETMESHVEDTLVEVDFDSSKFQAAIAVPTCLAETREPHVEDLLVEEPYINSEDMLTHNEPIANNKIGANVDEIIVEGTLTEAADNVLEENETPTIHPVSEEKKSMPDLALGSEPNEKIFNVLQKTDQEQGSLGTITSKDEMVNIEEVVGTQSTFVPGSCDDQTDIVKDQIEHTITENVSKELLDGDVRDLDSKEADDAIKEMVSQEISRVVEETDGIETVITTRHYSENAYKETDNDVEVFTTGSPSVSEETYIKSLGPAAEDPHTGSRDTLECKTAATNRKKSLQKILTMDYGDIFSTMKERLESESKEEEAAETNVEIEAKENNLEANIRSSEHLLEAITNFDQDDRILHVYCDAGTTAYTSEQVPLDEAMNKHIEEVKLDKAQSLNDSETCSIPSMPIQPIPLRPVVFSNEYLPQLDVVSEPNEPDGGESLDDSHHKDVAGSGYGEPSSLVEEAMHLNLQTETKEPQGQIPGVVQPTTMVESQNNMHFLELSEVHRELAQDEPDKGLLFERIFKRGTLLDNRKSFTQPDTDNMLAQRSTLTIAGGRELFTEPETDDLSAQRSMLTIPDDQEPFTQPDTDNILAQEATLTIADDREPFTEPETVDISEQQSMAGGGELSTKPEEGDISVQRSTLTIADDREPITEPETVDISEQKSTLTIADDRESFTQATLPITDDREPFTEPDTDNISAQGSTLTIATEQALTDTNVSHEGPAVRDQVKVYSSTKIVQHVEDHVESASPPLLITRQRSNTDPGLGVDDAQQGNQLDKVEPRTRKRSVTPPLDNFTTPFTATSPKMFLESRPLEKAQTSIVYPEVDYDISEEQKAEEATPRQNYTFFPTQIFNPLFHIQEVTKEQGFYQDQILSQHSKEGIGKKRMPSPPRDTEVLLRGQQPHGSPAASGATVETSATDPAAAHPVTPVWLPPRPLRHIESQGGRDFRYLQPNENPLVRRPTVRHKRSNVSNMFKRPGMNLPTIPQVVPSGKTRSLEENTSPAGTKDGSSSTTRQRTLPRQMNIREQEVSEPRSKSPMERLADAEESSGKSMRSPEAVLRRGKRSQMQPSTGTHSIHRRYSTLINSSNLLYQEYSDVALNQEIQRQKPGGSPAEDKDPGSPRQRRRILSSQDSYLQRLSISSADSLWQDLPKVRDSVTFMSMSREEQKLQEAKFELIMSEALYLRSLNIAVDHFQRSTELQDVLSNQDRQWLFSRLSEVRDASNDFLFDLEEEFENNMYNFQVCDVVISHEPNFRKVYLPYVTNQSYQDRTFQRLRNNNPRFQQVLSKLENDPVCQRLSLKSFLILPFQRITRLRLLLQNILKRSAQGSHEESQATEAHNAIEKLIRDCNEGVQTMKDTEELILLHQKIQFECKIFPLISASRRLVKHGEVTYLEFNPISFKWKGTIRPVYLHLFSDCLLLSRTREGGRFVVFDHASDFRVERCEIKLHSNQKNIFRVFLKDSAATQAREGYVDGHEMQYIFRTETQSQKLRWIYALSPRNEEIDLMRDGMSQVQCLKSYKARENDELSLEKADIVMVTQNSDDGWLCGIRLSDLHSGWFPQSHVQSISINACLRNLQEEQRLQTARAKLHPTGAK